MSVEPEELGWLSEIMYSTVRGAGGVLKAPRAIMNVFGIKAGEGLAETGQELQQISPASPSVSKEFSMSLMADPKWWASALPSLAVQILPITIAALGGGAVAAGAGATAAGVAAAEAGAGMLAGGLIGVSDAGERMLEYEKTHGDLPTVKKILIGLGAGTAGAVLPGKVLGRLVGEGGEKVLASQAVTKIFESDLGKAVAERAVRAVVGGNAMAGFSLIENAFEKFGYNPDRQLTQGVLESLILGTAFAGIESEIGLARRRAAASGREVELQALLAQRITDLQAAHNEAIERLKGGPFNRFGLDQLIGQETEAAQGTVKPPAPETPVGAPEAAGAIPGVTLPLSTAKPEIVPEAGAETPAPTVKPEVTGYEVQSVKKVTAPGEGTQHEVTLGSGEKARIYFDNPFGLRGWYVDTEGYKIPTESMPGHVSDFLGSNKTEALANLPERLRRMEQYRREEVKAPEDVTPQSVIQPLGMSGTETAKVGAAGVAETLGAAVKAKPKVEAKPEALPKEIAPTINPQPMSDAGTSATAVATTPEVKAPAEATTGGKPKIFQDADGWWRAENLDTNFGSKKEAQRASEMRAQWEAENAQPSLDIAPGPEPVARETPAPAEVPLSPAKTKFRVIEGDAGRKTAPTFFSQMAKSLTAKLPGKGTAESLLNLVKGWVTKPDPQNPIKADELRWTGLEDWLAQQQGTVTKQQILDHLERNQVDVKEVFKGEAPKNPELQQKMLEAKERKDNLYDVNFDESERAFGLLSAAVAKKEGQVSRATLMDVIKAIETGQGKIGFDYAWSLDYAKSFVPDYDWAGLRKNYEVYRAAFDEYEALNAQWMGEAQPTKYESYKLIGGENYRELLLTLPGLKSPAYQAWQNKLNELKAKYGENFNYHQLPPDEKNTLDSFHRAAGSGSGEVYRSAHWAEPNVLAHIRFDTRTDANGKKTLFIEEIQSDWHQEGKKKGYAAPREELAKAQAEYDLLSAENARLSSQLSRAQKERLGLNEEISGIGKGVVPKFTKQEIGIYNHLNETRHKIQAEVLGNFAVHRLPGEENSRNWIITHVPTGYKLMDAILMPSGKMTKTQAKEIIAGLNRSALDWSPSDPNFTSGKPEYFTEVKALAAAAEGPSQTVVTPTHMIEDPDLKWKAQQLDTKIESLNQQIAAGSPERYRKADELNSLKRGVAQAPFSKTWHELTLKRMLRYAAENGFDQLAWITGEKTKERYDLSKHLDSLGYWTKTNELTGWKDGRQVIKKIVAPADLENYVGKEVAERLMSDEGIAKATIRHEEKVERVAKVPPGEMGTASKDRPWRVYLEDGTLEGAFKTEEDAKFRAAQVNADAENNNRRLSGLQLQVGGEWANNLYDRMVPQFLDKYGKKWGARVTGRGFAEETAPLWEVEHPPGYPEDTYTLRGPMGIVMESQIGSLNRPHSVNIAKFDSKDAALAAGEELWGAQKKTGLFDTAKASIYEGPEYTIDQLKDMLPKATEQWTTRINQEDTDYAGHEMRDVLDAAGRVRATLPAPDVAGYIRDEQAFLAPYGHSGRGSGLTPALIRIIRDMENGESFKDAITNEGTETAKALGGDFVRPQERYQTIPVTPEMKESLLYQGQAMFSAREKGIERVYSRSLTTEKINERLGGNGTVIEMKPEDLGTDYRRGWEIILASGLGIKVLENKNFSLDLALGEKLNPEYAEKGITPEGRTIAGRHDAVPFGSVIELARAQGIRNFDHEVWHMVEEYLLTSQEREALIKKYGNNEEDRADAYAAWNPSTEKHSVFQKILDFFQTIVKALTGKVTGEDVFGKVRSGEIFNRAPQALPEAIAPGGKFGVRTWEATLKKDLLDMAKEVGYPLKDAQKFIQDAEKVYGWMIQNPETILDWHKEYKALKNNSDFYKKSLDFSTYCRKRAALTATMAAIQKGMMERGEWRSLTKTEIMQVRDMLYDKGYVTPCLACYREAPLLNAGKFTDHFYKMWKEYPSAASELYLSKTNAGKVLLDWLKKNGKPDIPAEMFFLPEKAPELLEQYHEVAKALGERVYGTTGAMAKGLEPHTEYNFEIRGISPKEVDLYNSRSGLRWQSWSDFQVPHLLDGMQAIYDMMYRGLKGHVYTKVPDFVRAFGLTRMKINMSLMPKGLGVEGGKLVYDPVEGMPYETAVELANKYPETAGTVLLGATREHIRLALSDPNIHYVIPYHRSGLPGAFMTERFGIKYDDFTPNQSWRYADDRYQNAKGDHPKWSTLDSKKDYDLIPKWAEHGGNKDRFFELCNERGLIPPFMYELERGTFEGRKGIYRPTDQILFADHPNYLKLITDVKFEHDGEPLGPQEVVKPVFDSATLQDIMQKWDPAEDGITVKPDQGVVKAFLDQTEKGGGKKFRVLPPEEKEEAQIAVKAVRQLRKELNEEGGIPSYKEFQAQLAANDSELDRALKTPGVKEIPLYEGERFTSRAGNQIVDAKGETRLLDNQEIYERFYAPRQELLPAGEEAPKVKLGTPEEPGPEGTVEMPKGILGKAWREVKAGLKSASLSEAAQRAWSFVQEQGGWAAREMGKDALILDKYKERFSKMNLNDLIAFTDAAETKSVGELRKMAEAGEFDSELVEAAQAWRRISDGLHYLMAHEDVVGKDGEIAYWTNYFARNYKNPAQAAIAIEAYLKARGRSLTGPEEFRKARTLLLFSEAIKPIMEARENADGRWDVFQKNADGTEQVKDSFDTKQAAEQMVDTQGGLGLEPLYPNYVDMMKANIHSKLRFLMGKAIQNAYQEVGFISREAKPGYERLTGDKTLEGMYAHPDVARVLDTLLSGGLSESALFQAFNKPTTFINSILVGLSAFHATFSICTSLAWGIGLNASRAVGAALTGRFSLSGHYIAEMVRQGNIPLQLIKGGKGLAEWAAPGSQGDAELSNLIDILEKGGMRGGTQTFRQVLDNFRAKTQTLNPTELGQMSKSFSESMREQLPGMPRKVIELISWPIMGWMVPRLKTAFMLNTLKMELATAVREGRTYEGEALAKLAQDIVNKADNSFGQLIYDNLSMKRVFRDALRIPIGFPGWNIGSFTDIAQALQGLTHLGKEAGKGALEVVTGKMPTYEKMSRQQRMSLEFYAGTVLMMAVFGAFFQKLMTDKWPDGPKDYLMPQTGALMPNGQPERMRLPTYMRDVLGLAHPVEMAKHKLNVPLRMFGALTSNQDFFGEQIRDPYATLPTQTGQTLQYLGKSLLPFGVQGYVATESPRAKALNLMGITKVPRLWSNTEAMNLIDEYNTMNRASMTSKEAAAEKKLKQELRRYAADSDKVGFEATAKKAMQEGVITKAQVKAAVEESQNPPGVGRFVAMPLEWQIRAMGAANEKERALWTPYLLKKVYNSSPELIIRNREPLAQALDGLGYGRAAMVVRGLELPETKFPVDLSHLGITKPAGAMQAGIDNSVSQALKEHMEKWETAGRKEAHKSFTPTLKKKKSTWAEILGLS
jgi:hypothetical protein